MEDFEWTNHTLSVPTTDFATALSSSVPPPMKLKYYSKILGETLKELYSQNEIQSISAEISQVDRNRMKYNLTKILHELTPHQGSN